MRTERRNTMPTNSTHPESISPSVFGKKFKNPLRDYYNYGFLNFRDFREDSAGNTIRDTWERLNKILENDFSWSQNINEVMYLSTDSQSTPDNPFHKIYRYCLHKPDNMQYLFHIVFALSPKAGLTEGVESLEIDKICPGQDEQEIEDTIQALKSHLAKGAPLKIREIFYFYPDHTIQPKEDYKKLYNRLTQLKRTGIVQNTSKKGFWRLSPRTLAALLTAGTGKDTSFREHFEAALLFYSNYFYLGEVGTYLLDRFESRQENHFRFKHAYYMQTLNDFNLIDLICAIEQHSWCEIVHSSGMKREKRTMLCFPLEIRISTSLGREYLAYYEPFHHSYSFIRLEFIEAIVYHDKAFICKTFSLDQEEITREISRARESLRFSWGPSTTPVRENNAANDIQPEHVMFQITCDPKEEFYIKDRLYREKQFGTITEDAENHRLTFAADVADSYGLVHWIRSFYSRITVVAGIRYQTNAIQKEVQSFYNALTGIEGANFSIDPQRESSKISWNLTTEQMDMLPSKKTKKAKKAQSEMPHNLLFNELYGFYYHVMADALMQICRIGGHHEAMFACRQEDRNASEQTVEDCLQSALGRYSYMSGDKASAHDREQVLELLTNTSEYGGRFQLLRYVKKEWGREVYNMKSPSRKKDNQPRLFIGSKNNLPEEKDALLPIYSISDESLDFYRDLLPFTELECRWLLTILEDDKIHYFLSEEEIDAIRSVMQSEEKEPFTPFRADVIHYYDRFQSKNSTNQSQTRNRMQELLHAIRERHPVHIEYETRSGSTREGNFRPILLEYSNRDDCFRGYFQTCENANTRKDIWIFLFSSIRTLNVLDAQTFDYPAAQAALSRYKQRNTKTVTIQFTNKRNTPDRLLSEFSPWEKKCIYDSKTKQYTLTISYQKNDQKELAIRLMGYGSAIRFPDKSDPIYRDIVRRLEKQMDLFHIERPENPS